MVKLLALWKRHPWCWNWSLKVDWMAEVKILGSEIHKLSTTLASHLHLNSKVSVLYVKLVDCGWNDLRTASHLWSTILDENIYLFPMSIPDMIINHLSTDCQVSSIAKEIPRIHNFIPQNIFILSHIKPSINNLKQNKLI